MASVAPTTTVPRASTDQSSSAGTSAGAGAGLAPGTYAVALPKSSVVLPVITYHHVVPNPRDDLSISPATLEQQLKYLKSHGYTGITAAQLVAAMDGKATLPPKPVLVSFDDGRARQFVYARPLLRKYGFTATFFIYPSVIGDKSGVFMSKTQVRKLAKEGFDVESHTEHHRPMYRWGGETREGYLRRLGPELTESSRAIEKLAGKQAVALAYPMGYYDSWSAEALKNAGYRLAFTVDDGVNTLGRTPAYYMRRTVMYKGASIEAFAAMVSELPLDILSSSPTPGAAVYKLGHVSFTVPADQAKGRWTVFVAHRDRPVKMTRRGDRVEVTVPVWRLRKTFEIVVIRIKTPQGKRVASFGFPVLAR